MVTWGNTSVFGNATGAAPAPSSGFSFGAPAAAATPAPSSGFSFGAPAAAAPSAAAPAPSSGFSFGAPATAAPSTPTKSTSLFGSTTPTFGAPVTSTPAPATTGLFGTPNTTTPASTSLFGNPTTNGFTTPTTTTPSLFGNTSVTPGVAPANQYYAQNTTPAQAAHYAQIQAQQQQEAAHIQTALLSLYNAYSSNPSPNTANNPSNSITSRSEGVSFQHIFYDPKDQLYPHQSMPAGSIPPPPPHISQQQWVEAIVANPHPEDLAPTSLVGATALSNRIASQQEKAQKLYKYVQTHVSTLETLEKSSLASLQSIQYHTKQDSVILKQRMLNLMRKVELLRCMNVPLQNAERDIADKLNAVMKEINITFKKLQHVQEMALVYAQNVAEEVSSVDGTKSSRGADEANDLTPQEREQVFQALEDQRCGLDRVVNIMKKDTRDVDIMKRELLERRRL